MLCLMVISALYLRLIDDVHDDVCSGLMSGVGFLAIY